MKYINFNRKFIYFTYLLCSKNYQIYYIVQQMKTKKSTVNKMLIYEMTMSLVSKLFNS